MSATAVRPSSAPSRWPSLGAPTIAAPPGPNERSFGLTVGGVFLAIAAFSAWRGHTVRAGTIGGAGALLVLGGLVAPASLAPLARIWMRIAAALGWFNSPVLLTLMFALIITPFGLLAPLTGKH